MMEDQVLTTKKFIGPIELFDWLTSYHNILVIFVTIITSLEMYV